MAYFDILLPVKNGAAYLTEALDSIRAQTVTDWRLFVLDHGSTDHTLEIAQSRALVDPRIRIHSLPDARGLSGLLNAGLALCDAKYVVRHDADDIALPERLRHTQAGFAAHPDVVALGGQLTNFDDRGRTLPQHPLPTAPGRIAAAMLFCNPVAHPTVAMRLDRLQALGARYGVEFGTGHPARPAPEFENLVEDYFLFGQLALLGMVANVPQQLIRYRMHPGGVGRQKFAAQMAASQSVSLRLAERLRDMVGAAPFDPTPFCNHGGILFDLGGRTDFSAEFDSLRNALQRMDAAPAHIRRELRYRHTLANRSRPAMLARYALFRSRHRPVMNEQTTIKLHLLGRKGPRAQLMPSLAAV
ncbi:MAG: glycosyltransferase family 2 protein [Burkholderiaceae bacterium]|nr:glycosyltransferase family 2 protein [Burkholderiaceae bacterium]